MRLVPAINDVTYMELQFLLQQVAGLDSRLMTALKTKQLICVDNGQSSPCLDLRRTSHKLVNLVKQERVSIFCLLSNVLSGPTTEISHLCEFISKFVM